MDFGRRYRTELKEPDRAEALQHLRDLTKRRNLTLLTATEPADISEAAVLASYSRVDPQDGTRQPTGPIRDTAQNAAYGRTRCGSPTTESDRRRAQL